MQSALCLAVPSDGALCEVGNDDEAEAAAQRPPFQRREHTVERERNRGHLRDVRRDASDDRMRQRDAPGARRVITELCRNVLQRRGLTRA